MYDLSGKQSASVEGQAVKRDDHYWYGRECREYPYCPLRESHGFEHQ